MGVDSIGGRSASAETGSYRMSIVDGHGPWSSVGK